MRSSHFTYDHIRPSLLLNYVLGNYSAISYPGICSSIYSSSLPNPHDRRSSGPPESHPSIAHSLIYLLILLRLLLLLLLLLHKFLRQLFTYKNTLPPRPSPCVSAASPPPSARGTADTPCGCRTDAPRARDTSTPGPSRAARRGRRVRGYTPRRASARVFCARTCSGCGGRSTWLIVDELGREGRLI